MEMVHIGFVQDPKPYLAYAVNLSEGRNSLYSYIGGL